MAYAFFCLVADLNEFQYPFRFFPIGQMFRIYFYEYAVNTDDVKLFDSCPLTLPRYTSSYHAPAGVKPTRKKAFCRKREKNQAQVMIP